MAVSLAERIIQQRGISVQAVKSWAFRQGLPPFRRPLAWVVGLFARDAFTHDRLVIEEFCKASSRREVDDAINLLHRAPPYEHAFVRRTLGCRLSGRRLAELADTLFRQDSPA